MKGARTCRRCGEAPLRRPTRLCGFCSDELELRALKVLTGGPPDRSFAIFFLRDQGYSAEQVTEAKIRLAGGAEVLEVQRWLRAGDAEAVAV